MDPQYPWRHPIERYLPIEVMILKSTSNLMTQYVCTGTEDECEQNVGICGNHSMCINTLGSFCCKCMPGYKELTNRPEFTYDGQCLGTFLFTLLQDVFLRILWGQIMTNLRTLCLQARVSGGLPMCVCIYGHLVWANNIPICPCVWSLPMVWQTSTSAWKWGTSVVPMPTVATPSENTPAPVSQDMQSRMLRVTRALVRHLFVWMLFTFFCKL